MRKSVVYKYQIPALESFTLDLPKGSKVIRVDHIEGFSYLWALVPFGELEKDRYHFKGSKTGGVFEHENELEYIGVHCLFVQQEIGLYVFLDKIESLSDNTMEINPVENDLNIKLYQLKN